MTNDPGNHVRSRLETITTLVRQASQTPEIPYDAATFLASALAQLSMLEMHLNNLRDPREFVHRKTDRGYTGVQPAKLPHAQTVSIPNMGTVDPDSGMLSFELAKKVQPDPPIGTR